MIKPKYVDINKVLSLDSQQVIGVVHEIFEIRRLNDKFIASDFDPVQYKLQWRSFYDGWCEGRIDLLGILLRRAEHTEPKEESKTFEWKRGKLVEIDVPKP